MQGLLREGNRLPQSREFWGFPSSRLPLPAVGPGCSMGTTSHGSCTDGRRERSCRDFVGERPGLASSSWSCCLKPSLPSPCTVFPWNSRPLEGRRDVPRREKFRKGMDSQSRHHQDTPCALPHLSYKPNQWQGRARAGKTEFWEAKSQKTCPAAAPAAPLAAAAGAERCSVFSTGAAAPGAKKNARSYKKSGEQRHIHG